MVPLLFVSLTALWSMLQLHPSLAFTSIQHRSCSGQAVSTTAASSPFLAPCRSPPVLYSFLEQQAGESDIQFIKRITSEQPVQQQQQSPQQSTNSTASVIGKYQRIEEWDAQRQASGELTWEEKVQFDGQRLGNQVKQDSILRKHIGFFF
jgi:hypothetical protein